MPSLWRALSVVAVASTITLGAQGLAAAASPTTKRVSISSSEAQGSKESDQAAISANSRFVAFVSAAREFGAGRLRNPQLWVRDRQKGTTRLISRSSNGVVGNQYSYDPSVSANGRYVAFASWASNLMGPGKDTNGWQDVFIQDTWSSPPTMRKVSGFGTTLQGDGHSYLPSVSADGRYVAFYSFATNLVAGDTNGRADVFVRDLVANTISRVNVSTSGEQAQTAGEFDVEGTPAISADGRHVAFVSAANNLVADDTNDTTDIFVRDRVASTTSRVSVSTAGTQTSLDGVSYAPSISADGRYVAFHSFATNLVSDDTNGFTSDVFVRDRQASATTRVSVSSTGGEGSGDSFAASISADGRYVAFASMAPELVPNDTNDFPDVFIRDLLNGTTTRVSVSSSGVQGNAGSGEPSISANGRYVAFASTAWTLIPHDTNGWTDVFVRDRGPVA